MIPKTIRMRTCERIPAKGEPQDFRLCIRDGKLALDEEYSRRAQTRDALLTAVDPNDPPEQSAIAGTGDPGALWTGIQNALDSLPAKIRDEVGRRFLSYAEGKGWRVDGSLTAITTGDGGRRMTNFEQRARASTDEIVNMNARNAAFWASDAAQSHPAAIGTDNARPRTADLRTAAGMRATIAGINESNARHWAGIEASFARR
jgi:hypothetical protein